MYYTDRRVILMKSDMASTKMRVSCSHWHVFPYHEKGGSRETFGSSTSFLPFFHSRFCLTFNSRLYYNPWTDGCHLLIDTRPGVGSNYSKSTRKLCCKCERKNTTRYKLVLYVTNNAYAKFWCNCKLQVFVNYN